MVQQLQTGTYIDTYFRLLLVDSGFLFKVEIKIRTGSQINTGQATQADVILQVNRDINTVLLHSNIRVGIRNLDTSLGKLSKRDGDRLGFPVFPLEWHDPKSGEVSSGYRESGYLPEAVINFLALLGWNPGNDQEVMSMDELIKLFDLHRCSKSGAKFDYKKGIWFNHQYIQQKPNEEIAELFVPVLKEHGVEAPFEKVVTVVGMMKDRVSFVKELWETCSFFFVAPTEYDEKTVKKRWKEDSAKCMTELAEVIASIEDFSIEGQEMVVMDWIAEKGYHTGNIMNAFRLTLVGEGKGPHMFDISWVLGKEETVARMKRAVEVLK